MSASTFLNLFEAPVGTWGIIGDFNKNSSFKNADRALVTHPKAIEKARQRFLHTQVQFDFYFVNTPAAGRHTEVGEVAPDFIERELKLTADQFRLNPNAITVFFTNNKGDERIAMTAWIIAHRFAHVLSRGYPRRQVPEYHALQTFVDNVFISVLGDYGVEISAAEASGNVGFYSNEQAYASLRKKQNILRYFAQTVGTMKSARDKNLRNFYEFHHELLAQYLTTGKIAFNPLPRAIVTGYTYGRPQYRGLRYPDNFEAAQEEMTTLTQEYAHYAENLLSSCVGRVFVM